MRALYQKSKQDSNENVYLVKENVEVPDCRPGQVKVKVKACALSSSSTQSWSSLQKHAADTHLSVGYEVAGVVAAVGSGVDFLTVGDHVAGLLPPSSGCSGCSEYCVTSQHYLVKLPPELPFSEAAAMIGDGVRAYTALHYLGHVTSGDTVLVLNGASTFGSLCIQIAQLWGAKVLTTSSSEEDKSILEKMTLPPAHVIEVDQKGCILTTSVMEETGGTGVDLLIDSGVRLFTSDEDMRKTGESVNPRVPHKHDIISCLAVGGRWVTSRPDIQLDPPDSKSLFLRGASLCFLFEHVWTFSMAQHGRFQHILCDVVEQLANKQLRAPPIKTVSMENAVDSLSKLSRFQPHKVVVTI